MMLNERRKIFKKLAVITGTFGAFLFGLTRKSKSQESPLKRYGMAIDLRKCCGCQACAVACKSEFNVRLGGYRSWVNEAEKGKFPITNRFFLPRLCNHCETPGCTRVCPTKASYIREDGIVMVDKDQCIGCRYCMQACPYGARYFNWLDDKSTDKARAFGTVDKCDFCFHRISNGVVPSCVNTCPAKARIFGDLNDTESEISKFIGKNAAQTLMPEFGTKPHVYYVGADESVMLGSPKGGN
jgi:tetrathionate reductase subunit B